MEFSDLRICAVHTVQWELHTHVNLTVQWELHAHVNLTAQYGVLRSPYMHIPRGAVRTTYWRKSHCTIWSSQISVYAHKLCNEHYMLTWIPLRNMELSDLHICTFHVVQWELHTDVNLTAQYGVLRSPYMHINCVVSTACWCESHCTIWSSQISVYVHSTLCSENYMPTQISLCNMEFSDLHICIFHTVWWALHADVNSTAQYGVLRSLYICLWKRTLLWALYIHMNLTAQYGVLRSLYICLFVF